MLFQHSRCFHKTWLQHCKPPLRFPHCHTTVRCKAVVSAPQHPLLGKLTPAQLQKMDQYLDVLLETNQNLNLTAVRDKGEAWQRHVVDSLLLQPVIEQAAVELGAPVQDVKLLDVGSGGGLPGMILAIARPDWHVTMLDSLNKRCTFLNNAIKQVGIPNAESLWSRAEEAGQKDRQREAYNIVVARAVAELRVLAELCLPFAAVGGVWVAAKGPNPQEEVAAATKAIQELGGTLHSVVEVESKANHGSRTAVIVRKTAPTPQKYPRRPGMPSKRPL